MDSLRDFRNKLDSMRNNLKEIEGSHSYGIKEIFTDGFMKEYTSFESIQEFVDKSPADFSSQESFKSRDTESFNKFISNNSKFSSWEEMLSAASKIMLSRKIMN